MIIEGQADRGMSRRPWQKIFYRIKRGGDQFYG
jgi:hypothetical protein